MLSRLRTPTDAKETVGRRDIRFRTCHSLLHFNNKTRYLENKWGAKREVGVPGKVSGLFILYAL